ncbi:MAG TPA: 3-phosphoshikimate 1-carboxyvinyltransferase [Candidatus Aquicultor sp.]|jgi:3-phosphoshikimate 1-carboxyvinyltransferase
MQLKVSKANKIAGRITVPGDKSISHRAVMLGAIADGITRVTGFLPADDCISTMRCFKALGVKIEQPGDTELIIHGVGLKGLREPDDVLDTGNSGTTTRILPGILVGQNLYAILNGDESIRRRPMGRIVDPLKLMGAQICGRAGGKFAPLSIYGSALRGIDYEMPVASAQVKTSLLLAGLMADGETVISETYKSRDHTERMLKLFGADITVDGTHYRIRGGQRLIATHVDVPGDISSAAFFIVAALILKDSKVMIENVGVNETRTGIIDALYRMGAQITFVDQKMISNEPRATIEASSSNLIGTKIRGQLVPRLIDEIPVLAVAATQANGKTVIRDAQELRVKESDRIAALGRELRKMGAHVSELEDGIIISGPTPLRGAKVKSHGDHRIAMALAIAGMVADGETIIENSDCIAISYPRFEETLHRLLDTAIE